MSIPPTRDAAKTETPTDTPPERAPVHSTAPRRASRAKRLLSRLILSTFLVLLLVQIPFVYRRFELRALRISLEELNARRMTHDDQGLREYTGVMHVHTSLGGHSAGTHAEVIEAARANNLDFVVMTEHTEGDYDTAALTPAGRHGGILFLPGNETRTATGARFLVLPGATQVRDAGTLTTADFTSRERAANRLLFVAYPSEFDEWDAAQFDGIEIYNLFTDARRANPLVLFFDYLWSLGGNPELLFARLYERPSGALERWDEMSARRAAPTVAVAGNDAHANVGVHLRLASGERLAGVQLDPYERSFRVVRMHVLLRADEELTQESLLAALGEGRGFIAFDIFGDASGFRFTATNPGERRTIGEQIRATNETALHVRTPLPSHIVLFRDGERIGESTGVEATFAVAQTGAYRVEVYLDNLPLLAGKPWIISNHIHVKE